METGSSRPSSANRTSLPAPSAHGRLSSVQQHSHRPIGQQSKRNSAKGVGGPADRGNPNSRLLGRQSCRWYIFLDLNGVGKSTVIQALAVMKPVKGCERVDGKALILT
jgi:hypothetical protein